MIVDTSCCNGTGFADYAAVPCPNPKCPTPLTADPFALPTSEPVESVKPIVTDPVAGILLVRGRYALPDPFTGEARTWQRVTNFISAMDDSFALRNWREDRVVIGLGQRPGLVAQAASLTLADEDRRDLRDVTARALDAAGANEGSDMGTALHHFTARYDRGEIGLMDVPEPYRADISAYIAATAVWGIYAPVEYVERTTCVPEYNGGVVGTFDRLVRTAIQRCSVCPPDVLHVADLKTGQKELDYGQLKASMQLHCYAMGAQHTLWDAVSECWQDQDAWVCQHVGVLICLPAGSGECTLHDVDLNVGRTASLLACKVHATRRLKPVTPWE